MMLNVKLSMNDVFVVTKHKYRYYSIFNIIQILNVVSNINKLFSSTPSPSISLSKSSLFIAKGQLFLSMISFVIGIYIFCNNSSIEIIGIISLSLYHLISYLREKHYDSASIQHKSFKRIEPLSLLFAAFIVLSLSLFQHLSLKNLSLPHHEHKYDIQEQFANDERAFMHHSANHDIDTSAKITHRRMLLTSSKPKLKSKPKTSANKNKNKNKNKK